MTVAPAELFPRQQQATAYNTIVSRLPQRDWVKVSDICIACDCDKNTVYAWIDEGKFESVNLASGTDQKAFRKIHRLSFLRFIQTRIAGA